MDIEAFYNYCLSKKASEACFPFDKDTLVFKVLGKMFAIVPLEAETPRANLKVDPEYVIQLREQHPQVIEGWHMSKKHWNTVLLDAGLSDSFICSLVDHSWEMVVKGMTKKMQRQLESISD